MAVRKTKPVAKSTEATPTPLKKRTLREIVKEPSTVAGVLSIVSQALLAGPASLTNPGVWAGMLAGVGLIFTKEGQ